MKTKLYVRSNYYSALKVLVLAIYLAEIISSVRAQNEFSKWYFGTYAGLDFSTSPPTALTNGTMIAPEGCATVSDAAGNLLFYTEGSQIFNSAHLVMANGSGLNGDPSSSQAAVVIKKPGSSNLFYVFTTNQNLGAYYSVVDISLAAGMGSVTIKNNLLHSSSTEKQVSVRHCNGTDAWIVGHEKGTNTFWSYLLTTTGVNTNPVLSSIGTTLSGVDYPQIGQLKVSPNGKLLATTVYSNSTPFSLGDRGFYLFNFEPATGAVSNSLTLLNTTQGIYPYGIEFSPDGSKLYGTSLSNTTSTKAQIYQWDVCQTSTAAIVNSVYSFTLPFTTVGSVQRAIDNKLYVTSFGFVNMSVIHNPNNAGAAMNFSLQTIPIANKQARTGFPNWINLYQKPPAPLFTNTVACQTASFTSPSVFTFSDNCSASSYYYSTFLWDFGEPNAGTANTSTLSNPIHSYASIGSYTVKLIQYSMCSSDTVNSIINITTIDPPVSILGKTIFCKGEQRVLSASGATSYLWSNSATTSTIAVSPTLTTVYTLTASTASCNVRKSFTITVKECLGIEERNSLELKTYPNPFLDLLNIDAPIEGFISISSLDGKLLYSKAIVSGLNVLLTANLPNGVYLFAFKSIKGEERQLIFKH